MNTTKQLLRGKFPVIFYESFYIVDSLNSIFDCWGGSRLSLPANACEEASRIGRGKNS